MNIVKKRGWVKNAAIVFLAVMLGLTFFSNTIRNRSLPEVAAQYTQAGSITARIRGSGTVTANESFDVKNGSLSRTVSERPVTKGDEVKIGDVLIKFDVDASDAIEEAKKELHAKELELEKMLLDMSRPDGSLASMNSAVQAARDNLTDAQRSLAVLPPFSEVELNQARTLLQQAQTALAQAQSALAQAQAGLVQPQIALDAANAFLAVKEGDVFDARSWLLQLLEDNDPPGTIDPSIITQARLDLSNAEAARDAARIPVFQAQDAYFKAKEPVDLAELAITNATDQITERQSLITTLEANRELRASANAAVRSAQLALADALLAFSNAQADAGIDTSKEAIDLRELKNEIEKMQDNIEKLEKEGKVSELTSLVAGIVTKIEVNPGDTAEPEAILMVIEVVDRGYSLSFEVTSDQASRVAVGDQADVDRGWWSWGDEIRATLTAIRNNPQNPVAGRILTFAVSGDVESEMQLNLTLSQRSETFSIICPNGAIRSDTNGDFVLVVESRSSPLGNRFIATRADINILASDDVNTAISGALSGWDFVITRASAPVDPGTEVRLVDNP